jgi:hypothetical protein
MAAFYDGAGKAGTAGRESGRREKGEGKRERGTGNREQESLVSGQVGGP